MTLNFFFSCNKGNSYLTSCIQKSMCKNCCKKINIKREPAYKAIRTQKIFERIQVDISEICPKKLKDLRGFGFRYILSVLETLTKFAWLFPLRTLEKKETLLHLVSFFQREGVPQILQSDNGRQFRNDLMNSLTETLKTCKIHGAAYHPETQGQVERFHRSIKSSIYDWMARNIEKTQLWSLYLPSILNTYLDTPHSSTKLAPSIF